MRGDRVMLNAERFKEKILDVVEDDKKYDFAIKDDDPNAFYNCHSDIPCKNCIFTSLKNGKNCLYNRFNWLLSEYKEPVKLTRLEYDILKYLSDNTKYMYIVRDGNGNIFLYDEEPQKSESAPWWTGRGMCHTSMFNKLFQFVQWEDSTPTLIKDVLENCEVVNDAEE